jgi:hypothetical protein
MSKQKPGDTEVERALAILEGTVAGQDFRVAELRADIDTADKAIGRFISERRKFFRTLIGELASLPRCKAIPLHCMDCTYASTCQTDSQHDVLVHAYQCARMAVEAEYTIQVDKPEKQYASKYAATLRTWLFPLNYRGDTYRPSNAAVIDALNAADELIR